MDSNVKQFHNPQTYTSMNTSTYYHSEILNFAQKVKIIISSAGHVMECNLSINTQEQASVLL